MGDYESAIRFPDFIYLEVEKACQNINFGPAPPFLGHFHQKLFNASTKFHQIWNIIFSKDLIEKSRWSCKRRRNATTLHDSRSPILISENEQCKIRLKQKEQELATVYQQIALEAEEIEAKHRKLTGYFVLNSFQFVWQQI